MSKKKSKSPRSRVRVRVQFAKDRGLVIEGPKPPLSIYFDETNTIMYVRVSNKPVAFTRELPEEVLADYDEDGELVAFEVIGYQNGRAGRILGSIEKSYPNAAPAIEQLRELVPA